MGQVTTERIFRIQSGEEFNNLALEVFRYQASENPVYAEYLRILGISPSSINDPEEIPFLPIDFFRTRKVLTGIKDATRVFESSGTTAEQASRHYVKNTSLYVESFTRGFKLFYGNVKDYCILALLPSYLERQNSSLVFMANHLIRQSGHSAGGFYLDNHSELAEKLKALESLGHKNLFLGVSFALLEFAEKYPMKLKYTIVMETGGMKGRRKEITRDELHDYLTTRLGVKAIHSEYGMTELLSQAYSKEKGIFQAPPWMKILIRDPYDPFTNVKPGSSGGINIIDLANIHSCSFIATQDIGRLTSDGGFEVLGRFDHSEIRGCNLMIV
jgi:phenylacetate-coenzyme A ligase PaaK-like adenylate-forming protein